MSESKFKTNFLDIGEVKVGSKVEAVFPLNQPLSDKVRFHASCGCSKPYYDKEKDLVVVVYMAKPVPEHLKDKGYYTSTKTVKVTDGEHQETLTFKAIVYAK